MLRLTKSNNTHKIKKTDEQQADLDLDIALTNAAERHNFEQAELIYLNKRNSKRASAMTYSRMISAGGKCRKFEWVKLAYGDAVETGAVNAVIIAAMMTASHSFKRFDLIKSTYLYAIKNEKVDPMVFTKMMMYGAFNEGQSKWTEIALKDAQNAGMDAEVHQAYMKYSKCNSGVRTLFSPQNKVIEPEIENPAEKEFTQEGFSFFNKMPF